MRLLPLMLASGVAVLICANVCFACDCREMTAAESFQLADHVFVGTVMRVDNTQSPNKFIFQVAQSLKGITLTPTELFGGDTNCHSTFNSGGTYIVYARNEDGKLFADACMSTAPLFSANVSPPIYQQRRPQLSRVTLLLGLSVSTSLVIGFLVGYFWRRAA